MKSIQIQELPYLNLSSSVPSFASSERANEIDIYK